jgi:fructose/tagatose bisphosphate aldolase
MDGQDKDGSATAAVAGSVGDLLDALRGIVSVDDGRVLVEDESALRSRGIRTLAWTATFAGEETEQTAVARWIVREAAQALGARTASIQDLYMARGRGEVHGFTVPAINIRAQTFDMARTVFETALAHDVGAVILELARSEQTYTYQRPAEYATNVLAGAIAAGWRGPVFIQGDHYQFNAKKYAADPDAMAEEIRRACRLAVDAGYRNIDIDSSTLVDLSKPTVEAQQATNALQSADMTALIRSLESDGVTISVGGEIGEVGKENSTVEELRAYLAGYAAELDRKASGKPGISKVSVQTGTSHGGVVLPDGTVATVAVDFGVHEKLGAVAREHGLAGTVQHGASTLPDEAFHKFPAVETAEIHLATGFQNLLFDHPAFPKDLREQMDHWCFAEASDERKDGQTDQQFVYTTRKKTIGPFKQQLWDLATRDEILADQARKIAFLFDQLKVVGSRSMVDRYVRPVEVHAPPPDAVRSMAASRA